MTSLTGKVVLIFNCFIKNKIITVVYDKKRRKEISLCVSNETNKPFTFYTEYILLFFENDTKTKANRTRRNANSIQQIIIGEIGPIAILICYAHTHTQLNGTLPNKMSDDSYKNGDKANKKSIAT